MKEKKNGNSDFITLWGKCKIEQLRNNERLCSAIMDVLQIADDSSEGITIDGLIEGEIGNRTFARKIHPPMNSIDWVKHFDKSRMGAMIGEDTDYQHWYGKEREGGSYPGWIQTCYGQDLGSFSAGREKLDSDISGKAAL